MAVISIIVPVYNAEEYLERCIESVLCQAYCQWELILADDGSTDQSGCICKKYAEKDQRIFYVHTENYGRVHARKVGLQKAKGRLVTFLDSDDWLEPEALWAMSRKLQETSSDCVAAGYIETSETGDRVILNRMPAGLYQKKKLEKIFYPSMLCCSDFFEAGVQPFLCNKLFRREIIEDFVMGIDERIVVGEDAVCVYPAFLKADAVYVMDQAFYHYYIHKGCTTKNYRTRQQELENIQLQYTYLKSVFQDSQYVECLLPQAKRYLLHHLMVRVFPSLAEKIGSSLFSPFGELPADSRVIIYGAGVFGNSIFHYLGQDKKNGICAWCDKQAAVYQKNGYQVCTIEEALAKEFDYILIAVMSEKTAETIRTELEMRGTEPEKIRWLDVSFLDQWELSDLFS